MDRIVNNNQLAWNLTFVLKTLKKKNIYSSIVKFSKYVVILIFFFLVILATAYNQVCSQTLSIIVVVFLLLLLLLFFITIETHSFPFF